MRKIIFILIGLLLGLGMNAQNRTIQLTNPSFEDQPRHSFTPKGWLDCGQEYFQRQTPPDIQPGFFYVSLPPFDGDSYLGLVVRDNDTWESVSQRLLSPLSPGKCYEISLYLAHSNTYISEKGDRVPNTPDNTQYRGNTINHDLPVTLRIWGGKDYCDKKQSFVVTDPISHTRWVKYTFKLEPQSTITHLTFESFYKTPIFFPYNGNLLVDNISEITEIDCAKEIDEKPYVEINRPSKSKITVDEEYYTFKAETINMDDYGNVIIVINNNLVEHFNFDNKTGDVSSKIKLFKGKNSIKVTVNNRKGSSSDEAVIVYDFPDMIASVPDTPVVPTIPKVETSTKPTINSINKNDLRKGQTIKINKLYFGSNSFEINKESYPALDDIFDFMKSNPGIYVEIGGHTNGTPSPEFCDKLSSLRAKAVAQYLVDKGIPTSQVAFKGYGKRKPVATNKTKEGRTKNQRVEIKILSIG